MKVALPEALAQLGLDGRADDPSFAQQPEPVVAAMAHVMAAVHRAPVEDLESRTAAELDQARAHLGGSDPVPEPFARVDRSVLLDQLADQRWQERPHVHTHGAPIVGACVLADGEASFEDMGTVGADPVERDLAIALRSVAVQFGAEATRIFLDAYDGAGGQPYELAVLDWYAVVAAFR